MSYKFFFYFLILSLISCKNNKDQLFYIKNYSDLLYMAQSTNVKILNKKTSIYLTSIEKKDEYYTYKNFGEIYKNDFYTAFIIFSEMIEPELQYSFEVRTLKNKDNIFIDSYYLSGYSHDSGEFCKGSISKNLIIEKHCDSDDFNIKKKINNFGQIIDLN